MMTTSTTITESYLIEFIINDLMLNRLQNTEIKADTDLISAGVIDSLSLIQLVTYLEAETGLSIPDQDVNPENFQTVSAIVKYINTSK